MISLILIIILNAVINNNFLIFANKMFGYGYECTIYSLLSNCIYFIMFVGAILSVIKGIKNYIKKEQIEKDVVCNGLIIFILLTIVFVPSYSNKYLIFNEDNYVYSRNLIRIVYSSDDTEQYIMKTSYYLYIPIIKKYFIIDTDGIDIYSVRNQTENTITIEENDNYIEYEFDDEDYTVS